MNTPTTAQLEAQLEALFRKRVRDVGGYTIKLAPTERGVPDRLVIFPKGRMYLVELKTPTGILSPIQMHWHDRMAARGVTVHTLYGEDDIRAWLRWVLDHPSRVHRSRGDHRAS